MGGVIVKGDGLETRGRRMEKACHMRKWVDGAEGKAISSGTALI